MNEKLKRIHLYYYDISERYEMEIEIGNKQRSVSFKMNDEQTRKVIKPLISALCEACAVNAGELKQECINALGVNSNENNA